MPNPVEFYFDFSSPYGYIASEKIDALAAKYGREVTWSLRLRPVWSRAPTSPAKPAQCRISP